MHIVIKKGSAIAEIEKKLAKSLPLKGVDTQKYCGVIDLKEDALEIQRKMRNEWK